MQNPVPPVPQPLDLFSYKKIISNTRNVNSQRPGVLPPPPLAEIRDALQVTNLQLSWLAGDGSDRCYYRIKTPHKSYVLMQLSQQDAEKLNQNQYDWVQVSDLLRKEGVLVPAPIVLLTEFASLIIDDYGDTMLETAILASAPDRFEEGLQSFDKCFDQIAKMLTIPPAKPWIDRRFDEEKYLWELRFFREKFINRVLKESDFDAAQFESDIQALANFLAPYSKYFVHRDYHSRNIMVVEGSKDFALIDFQDARYGPLAYDLVSLCFDNYLPLTPQSRWDLLTKGSEHLSQSLPQLPVRSEMAATFAAVVLQRQLKAIGSYAFLTHDKNRGNYLIYVPPALESLLEEKVYDPHWPYLSGDLLKQLRAGV